MVAGLIALGLQGCDVAPRRPDTPIPPPPAVRQEETVEPQPSTAPAVALLEKAQRAQHAGRIDQAAASIERALRIDPYDPKLWHALAAIRLNQGDAAQAEAMAAKSNGMTMHDRGLQAENWSIIAQARRQQGDEQGARRAEQRARSFGP